MYSGMLLDCIVSMAKQEEHLDPVLDCLTQIFSRSVDSKIEFNAFMRKRIAVNELAEALSIDTPEN